MAVNGSMHGSMHGIYPKERNLYQEMQGWRLDLVTETSVSAEPDVEKCFRIFNANMNHLQSISAEHRPTMHGQRELC